MAKNKESKGGFDLGAKLKNIQFLVTSKRPKEAIAYEFMLFAMLSGAKFKERKLPSQSIRDFAMITVKKHNMDPAHIYPFIQKVEEVIYGGRQPSVDVYNQSIGLFGKVFEDLVGKPLPPTMIMTAI